MTKFFNKYKKPYSWPIFCQFCQFWEHKKSPKNPALSHTASNGFLAPCQNLEKANDPISRKYRTDGWTDK